MELTDDALVVSSNFRRRSVPRETIESVTWEKGGGVSLKLSSGQWY